MNRTTEKYGNATLAHWMYCLTISSSEASAPKSASISVCMLAIATNSACTVTVSLNWVWLTMDMDNGQMDFVRTDILQKVYQNYRIQHLEWMNHWVEWGPLSTDNQWSIHYLYIRTHQKNFLYFSNDKILQLFCNDLRSDRNQLVQNKQSRASIFF